MQQVLFTIPPGIPVYGYGTMLFLAFVLCTWLAIRLGRREGIHAEVFQELSLWLFVSGILGARVTYIIQNWSQFRTPTQYFAVWDGGLVFYGSVFGGIVGYLLVDHFLQKKHPYDRWKILDCVAPCIALGLCLGRIGCLLNGCCYGNVACTHCPSISFPLSAPPRFAMVERGYQSPAGFTLDRDLQRKVDIVEPGSPADLAGLKSGDLIVKVNDVDIVSKEKGRESFHLLHDAFTRTWPRGKNDLILTVESGREGTRTVGPFSPRTVPLHPTQLYETISMAILLFFLVAYFPFRRADGVLMVMFMVGYAVHRFLNEMLRTDTDPVAFGMTLSQNISLLVLGSAVILGLAVWSHSRRARPAVA